MTAISCLFVASDSCSSSAKKLSETLTKNLTENITNSVVNIAKSSGSYVVGNQVADFSGMVFRCKGGVRISGISQKMVASINFSQMLSTVNEESLRQMLTTALQKTVESDLSLKTSFMGSSVNTLDQSKTISENISKIVAGYTYNDFTNDTQNASLSQTINFKGTVQESDSVCTIDNISQDLSAEILSKSIVQKMLSRAVSNSSQLDIKVAESTVQSAVSEGVGEAISGIIGSIGKLIQGNILMFVLILIVILAGIALSIYGVYRLVTA